MGLFDSLKANKAIEQLTANRHASSPEFKEAFNTLKQLGPAAIDKLIDAFGESYPNPAIETLLLGSLDNKTLKKYVDGLAADSKRIVAGVTEVMCQSKRFDANRLYDLFDDKDIPKTALLKILHARRASLDKKKLLQSLDSADRNTRQLIFHLLNDIADYELIPQLISALQHKDPDIRQQLALLLGKFDNEQVRDSLLPLLEDPAKIVRLAALTTLGKLSVPVSARPLTRMLRDADFTVQSKAIETLGRIKDPDIVQYLLEMLQDDSEHIRRAAVEVLNQVGNQGAVKDLLNAMRDQDWWVRARAADALGSIGGEPVINAVLDLIKDKDEFLRRAAVEILNKIKDERAVTYLLAALEDSDWWVRERAADALADMGEKRAVEPLLAMLAQQPDVSPAILNALVKLGGKQIVPALLKLLQQPGNTHKRAIIKALEKVADPDTLAQIQEALVIVANTADPETQDLANQTLHTIITSQQPGGAVQASTPSAPSSPSNLGQRTSGGGMAADQFIDPESLAPGQILNERYKIKQQIGKGAFGVVVLVEDLMVGEQIILKFLNPHMASDQTVIDRFVQELRYTRRVTHPNVIRIFDFLTFGRSYAISMEYFASHSLAKEIKSRQTRDFKRNLRILVDICKGLVVAHKLNIVHRDIKPANILINDQDLVKIVDFGLASAVSQGDSRLTKSGILVGTPTYMAPEQVRGRTIDIRTDIYSLGIVMYEIFTGKPPYKESDHMATLFKHVEGKARPANVLNPVISEHLNKVIMRAIHVDPESRYQRIEELQHELESLLQETVA